MKRIIIESRHLFRETGISKYFVNYIKQFIVDKSNYNFIIVTDYLNNTNYFANIENVKICKIKRFNLISNKYICDLIYGFITFPLFLLRTKADLLISPYYDFIIPPNYKNKTIITLHDLCYIQLKQYYNYHHIIPNLFFLNQALKKSKKIFTVSEKSKKDISLYLKKKRIYNKKIIIIYNSFKKINPEKKIVLNNHDINIIYTGGFEKRKNIDNIFKAFSKSIQTIPQLKLIITGNLKNNKKFQNKIIKYQLQNNTYLTGILTDSQLQGLYENKIDGAINISLCEGFGRNSYEAKINCIPLLCSDIKINHEIVGDYPIYCDPFNTDEIASGIHQLVKSSKIQNKPFIDSKFTIEYNYPIFSSEIINCL